MKQFTHSQISFPWLTLTTSVLRLPCQSNNSHKQQPSTSNAMVETTIERPIESLKDTKQPPPATFTDKLIHFLQVIRVIIVAVVFLAGTFSIVFTQFVFKLGFARNYNIKNTAFALTKQHFVILLTSITNFICPSKIRVTSAITSALPKGSFKLLNGNQLHSALSTSSVVIANHQIYTDWVFLWWVAYTASIGDAVYIMLKNSLRRIPLLGYGMANYKFIFLSRKWENDSNVIENNLQNIEWMNLVGTGPRYQDQKQNLPLADFQANVRVANAALKNHDENSQESMKWPYCLILFPEGTNMSPSRRAVSDKYSQQIGRPKLNHVLLPRVTGLRHSLRILKQSCDVVYDVTIGYSGVEPHTYGEAIYTLGAVFIKGKSPQLTDMYWRAFRIDDIPGLELNDDNVDEEEAAKEEAKAIEKFQDWLFGIWDEKDQLLDTYYKHGTFTPQLSVNTSEPNAASDEKHEVVVAELKPRTVLEFFQIFAVPCIILMAVRMLIKYYSVVYKLFA